MPRKPSVPDAEIAHLRWLHVECHVRLSELSALSGLSVSMLSKVMLGQRRKGAGGPIRASKVRPYSRQLKAAVRARAATGLQQAAVGRRYGISQGSVSKIVSARVPPCPGKGSAVFPVSGKGFAKRRNT